MKPGPFLRCTLAGAVVTLAGCAGVGPTVDDVTAYLADHGLSRTSPVAIVDVDDTIHDHATDRPMPDSVRVLRDLAVDHVIVYLTARPQHFKLPGLTYNRGDTKAFILTHGFPDGLMFDSSLWEWIWFGESGGKLRSLARLSTHGFTDAALAFGDKAHDLRAYVDGGSVVVRHPVIIFVDGERSRDLDAALMPADVDLRELPGEGSAWSQIGAAMRARLFSTPGAWSATETRP